MNENQANEILARLDERTKNIQIALTNYREDTKNQFNVLDKKK